MRRCGGGGGRTSRGSRGGFPSESWPGELPFQCEELGRQAKLAEADGNWSLAARAFERAADLYDNEVWMKTMAARAYYEAGNGERAGWLSGQVNRVRPTIDTL